MLTYRETADFLRAHDDYLILTHKRPDGDTVGCAAALCRMLRGLGKTAALLKNDEVTENYAPYAEGLWAAEDRAYSTVVLLKPTRGIMPRRNRFTSLKFANSCSTRLEIRR